MPSSGRKRAPRKRASTAKKAVVKRAAKKGEPVEVVLPARPRGPAARRAQRDAEKR